MCHPVFPGSLITPMLVKVEQRLLCSHNLLEGPQAECLCCCSRAVLWHLGTQPLECPMCPHSPSAAQGTVLAQHMFLAIEQTSLNSKTTSAPIPGASLLSSLPCASLSLGQGRHPGEWEICGQREEGASNTSGLPLSQDTELQVQHSKGCGSGLSQAQ